jgi:hypothetical protein
MAGQVNLRTCVLQDIRFAYAHHSADEDEYAKERAREHNGMAGTQT